MQKKKRMAEAILFSGYTLHQQTRSGCVTDNITDRRGRLYFQKRLSVHGVGGGCLPPEG